MTRVGHRPGNAIRRPVSALLLALAGLGGPAASTALADPDVAAAPNATVLAAICGRPADKDGKNCQMKDGRTAEFWSGVLFTTDKDSWYTGFATMPAPGEDRETPTQRTVAAATFVLKDGRWRLEGVQVLAGRIGTSGQFGHAPEVDDKLGPVTLSLGRNRALVGLRLTYFEMGGIREFAFLLLRFQAAPVGWMLAGELAAGSDATASCGSEEDGPCQQGASEGRLKILKDASSDPEAWPPVRVTLTGTVRDDDGKVRPATDRDSRVYRFDPASGVYR